MYFFVLFVLCFCLEVRARLKRREIGGEVVAAVPIGEKATVIATGVGAALPEVEPLPLQELVGICLRPANCEAPENGINLVDEVARIYIRVRPRCDETDVLIVGTAPLRIAGQLPSEETGARC